MCYRRDFIKTHLCAQTHHCHRKYEVDRWLSLPLPPSTLVQVSNTKKKHRIILETLRYAGVLQTRSHQNPSLCTGSPLPPEIRERSLALLTTATVDVSPCEQHRHITNTTQTLDTLKDQSCVILSSKYAKNQANLMLYNGLNHKKRFI